MGNFKGTVVQFFSTVGVIIKGHWNNGMAPVKPQLHLSLQFCSD